MVYCGGNPVGFKDPFGLVTMSDADKNAIKEYQNQYKACQANSDFVGMNKAHVAALEINKKYDPNYEDNYDYTHGGKIFNYTYSYEEFVVTKPDGSGQRVTVTGSVYILRLYSLEKSEREAIANRQSIGDNDFVVIDNRDNNDAIGHNPSMQIRDSYRATNETIRYAVIDKLLEYEKAYPYQYKWNREKESLENEWYWHNVSYLVGHETARTKDVDLDNFDAINYPRSSPFGLKKRG